MCGIAGFVGPGTLADLQAMTSALEHRGPDDSGVYRDPQTAVHLGHRRLAILDLDGGHQPMASEDGQTVVIFNGEIYNHGELREQLTSAGHRFESDHCDTEVLVHGYEQWGDALVTRLNGMFAFAIYDRRRRRVLLARDRFGKKPLFYSHTRGVFAFASELKALAEHPAIDRSVDPRSLQKLLAYSFLPAPNALYRGSHKLPGGHTLSFDLVTDRVEIDCYWRFQIDPQTPPPDAVERWTEELRERFATAVRRRLMSDVPLGVFLSGGIDSTAVLAFAAQELGVANVQTFSIGFREPSFDESSFARRAAAAIGSQHHEHVIDLDEARELVPDVLGRMDEPLGDPSLLPSFLLARFARQKITVALGGDGADELFAGYDPFKALGPAGLYQRVVPQALHHTLRQVVGLLPISTRNMSFDFKLRRALRGVSFPPALWNPVWLGALEPSDIADLFQQPIDPEDLYSEALAAWNECGSDRTVDRTLEFYTRLYLQDDILVKLDRATMLNSLEARCPFLDNDLVDFVARLPAEFKFRRGQTKWLLKRMLRGIVPQEILERRKKGFGVPLVSWLRHWGPSAAASWGGFDQAWTARRWQEHLSGKADHRTFLWCDLALQHHTRSRSAVAQAA